LRNLLNPYRCLNLHNFFSFFPRKNEEYFEKFDIPSLGFNEKS
jgi:hypothetical protein